MIDKAKHIAAIAKLRRIQPESALEAHVINRVKSSLLCAVLTQEETAALSAILGYPHEEYSRTLEILEAKLAKIAGNPEDTSLGLLTEYLGVKDTK